MKKRPMFKKILAYTGWSLLAVILGGYFYFAARLHQQYSEKEVCTSISVRLLDSAQNKFVSKAEVVDIIENFTGKTMGRKISEINLANIELLLNKRSAIKESQVSLTRNGKLAVEITQRRPILRIETKNGGFYVDETEYIFPLVESFTSYVPIVSGHIPLLINSGHRGKILEDDKKWMGQILQLGIFLDENPFWNAMIEQIYVDKTGDIILSCKVGNQQIIFGDPGNIEVKFNKLLAFYKNIAPQEGWDKYAIVNLKYKNQIVCKLNKNNKANKTL